MFVVKFVLLACATGTAALRLRSPPLVRVPSGSIHCRMPPVLGADDTDDGGIGTFLVQRAVQTQCFTARECRDSPTAQWLARRVGLENEFYHGLDGCKPENWREWLLDMMAAPPVSLEIESVLMKHRGLSASNPYLQPTPMKFRYELCPADHADYLMKTIQLLSEEWTKDLGVIAVADTESVWRERRAVVTEDDEEVRTTMPAFEIGLGEHAGSPYRAGTYDLLKALTTRNAARATLAAMAAVPRAKAARGLLSQHCESFGLFDGELPKRAADAFLSELLDLPVAISSLPTSSADSAVASLVDPRAVVEELLEWRTAVATGWIERLQEVPDELLEIRREHVRRSAGQIVV